MTGIKRWALFICGAALFWPHAAIALTVLAQHPSLYQTIYVTEEAELRCMRFSLLLPGRQSCMAPDQPDTLVLPYLQAMLGALLLQPKPQHMLFIGLGGGSLPKALRHLYPAAELDVVELDPAVAEVATRYFGFVPDAKLHVHIMDGRVFVKRAMAAGQQYDLVFLDAYNQHYIPEHLLTREFFAEVKSLLAPGGVVAANTAGSGALYAYESATYAAVFGTFYNLKPKGRVMLAMRDALPPPARLQENAARLTPALTSVGVAVPALLGLFTSTPDWPPDTPALTDMHAPANLLQAQ
jgi:spermidine synthase